MTCSFADYRLGSSLFSVLDWISICIVLVYFTARDSTWDTSGGDRFGSDFVGLHYGQYVFVTAI